MKTQNHKPAKESIEKNQVYSQFIRDIEKDKEIVINDKELLIAFFRRVEHLKESPLYKRIN
jgi:UV DNA damage repair endonuclease